MTKNTDKPIAGYNVTLTFNVGDLPFITDDETETKQYLYKKLMYMVAYEMYMIELHIHQRETIDDYYIKSSEKLINLLKEAINNHVVIKNVEQYTLTLPFIGEAYKEDTNFSREDNYGFILQFAFDMIRRISMCYYMQLKVEVLDSISIIKELPKTLDEWEDWDNKYLKERDYWNSKANSFKMETIYK